MKKLSRLFLTVVFFVSTSYSKPAHADLFGGDVAVLMQIYANAIQQLIQLKQILSTGTDTLDLLREVNRGIKDGLAVIQMIYPKFNPGIFGDLDNIDRALDVVQDLYGRIPQGPEASLQVMQDQAAAESISMNGTLFKFADQADEESRRIIAHAANVNPQGAGKLTAQSIAVLIGVTTQVLRTNSMMLKLMGQDLAIANRKGKLESEQFKEQYQGLSSGFRGMGNQSKLTSLKGG